MPVTQSNVQVYACQLLDQIAAAKDTEASSPPGSPESVAAISSWSDAIDSLLSLVVAHAGPAPSALRLNDATLLVASLDAFGYDGDTPILTIVERDRLAHAL
jgi:hypothetical protein